MAEKYEPDEWEAVVCNGFTAVNVLSSNNVEELGWDFTEMELDPTGTCGLFEGMLLDWDDDTPEERREHEEYFPDAFTVGARILADEWDHELSNDEVRSRCFLIIEHADQFTDHDTGRNWQEDCLPCVCHRGGQGEDDRWEYEPAEDYRPFTRPADIPESIFDKLCASQGTTIEKVVNDPVTPFERSFREDIFNMPQNRPVGLAVLATLPLDAFLDASLSMICRGEGENAGTFTVKPGTYEPILGIYDPVGGCGGTMGTVLDCDFEIDPHDIAYTMMEPVRGEWKSDRIDLYTPQDCFGFSDPFGGRIEYSEKKPEIAVAVKPDPVELGHRASVAASSTAGGRARGAGIRQ